MSNVKFELSYKGIGEILKGPDMESMLKEKGESIAGRCGTGYEARTHNSGQRQILNVYAADNKAKQDNLRNNTLLKNLY